MEQNLFSQLLGKIAEHKNTGTKVLIIGIGWCQNQMDFDVLVPQKDEKGKTILCNATYSQTEIKIYG